MLCFVGFLIHPILKSGSIRYREYTQSLGEKTLLTDLDLSKFHEIVPWYTHVSPKVGIHGWCSKVGVQGRCSKVGIRVPRLVFQGWRSKVGVPRLVFQGWCSKVGVPRLVFQGWCFYATLMKRCMDKWSVLNFRLQRPLTLKNQLFLGTYSAYQVR